MRSAVGHRRNKTDGFALADVTLALMLMALLSALALPGLARHIGAATLRVTAFQVSALLREDRNAAMRSGRPVIARVTRQGLRSGATGEFVPLPYGDSITGPASIRFTPDGRASDADIVIASDSAQVMVSVSPDTGSIHVSLR